MDICNNLLVNCLFRPNSSNVAASNVHASNKSKADQAKLWREKNKKSDPDFMERERIRKQIYRMKRTPEEKRADNVKQKVRLWIKLNYYNLEMHAVCKTNRSLEV